MDSNVLARMLGMNSLRHFRAFKRGVGLVDCVFLSVVVVGITRRVRLVLDLVVLLGFRLLVWF